MIQLVVNRRWDMWLQTGELGQDSRIHGGCIDAARR